MYSFEKLRQLNTVCLKLSTKKKAKSKIKIPLRFPRRGYKTSLYRNYERAAAAVARRLIMQIVESRFVWGNNFSSKSATRLKRGDPLPTSSNK